MDFEAALKWLISTNATTSEVEMGRVGEPLKSTAFGEFLGGSGRDVRFRPFTHDVI